MADLKFRYDHDIYANYGLSSICLGMGPPSHKETIDPQKVDQTAPFDNPGVNKVGENEYEVVMTLQVFSFNPGNIEVPAGSTVHFTLTSKDVVHGFQVAEYKRKCDGYARTYSKNYTKV